MYFSSFFTEFTKCASVSLRGKETEKLFKKFVAGDRWINFLEREIENEISNANFVHFPCFSTELGEFASITWEGKSTEKFFKKIITGDRWINFL